MHHGSPMPCLDLGHWGEPWVICVSKYRALSFFSLFTRLQATFLGICRALSIAESSKRLGYPLSMSCFLISWSLLSLFSGSLQILIILMLNPKGMAFLVWAGWHELGNKYWFLSVSFLNKSVSMRPSIIEHEVSKKGIEVISSQSHLSSSGSSSLVVWLIVNSIVGCTLHLPAEQIELLQNWINPCEANSILSQRLICWINPTPLWTSCWKTKLFNSHIYLADRHKD